MCGDSIKHKDKCHCSIWIRPAQPLVFHCWVCEESGIVNNNFLQSMGINDISIANMLGQYNKASMRGKKEYSFKLTGKDAKVEVPSIEDNEINRVKLEYMKQRLGVNFTYKSMEYLRMVFSIKDFITLNELKLNSKYYKARYYLENDMIGFLSSSRETIIMRSINKDSKIRYIKYSVFEDNLAPDQMYIIPTKVNPLAKEINLNITEGTFDILGVFFHVTNRDMNNSIYAAIGGSAYKRVIQYFLKKGFISNLNVNIYSDNDKKPEFYYKLFKEFSPWVKSFRLFYNAKEGEKDFGVTKDRILVREVIL